MRKLSLTKWIISVFAVICFSSNLSAATRASAAADGETNAASIQVSDADTSSYTKLYLYCKDPDGQNDQICHFLIHAVCPVKGITFNGAQTSTCTLSLSSISVAAFTGFGGSTDSEGSITGQNTLTSGNISNLVALDSGTHATAVSAAVNGLGADDTAINETALGITHTARPCLAFASNAVADIKIDDDTGNSWADGGADSIFTHLHASGKDAPAVGYELTGWGPEFNRYEVIGANDEAFTVQYDFTVESHTVNSSQTCE